MNDTIVWQVLSVDTNVVALAGQAIYPTTAPQNAPYPRVVYRTIVSTPATVFEAPDTDNVVVLLDVYGRTRGVVVELAEAVRAALEPHGHERSTAFDEFDPTAKVYRRALSFSLWLNR